MLWLAAATASTVLSHKVCDGHITARSPEDHNLVTMGITPGHGRVRCWLPLWRLPWSDRVLKFQLRCDSDVENGLKMRIYGSLLRLLGRFRPGLATSSTNFNALLRISSSAASP